MIGIAKTGSGKTLAFVLPMFRHIKDQPPLEGDDGPIGNDQFSRKKQNNEMIISFFYFLALVMTPTRELALQTMKECKKFAKLFNIRCVAVYGGTGISEQIVSLLSIDLSDFQSGFLLQAELKRGAEIIVCTPGRMIDMLAANGGTR